MFCFRRKERQTISPRSPSFKLGQLNWSHSRENFGPLIKVVLLVPFHLIVCYKRYVFSYFRISPSPFALDP